MGFQEVSNSTLDYILSSDLLDNWQKNQLNQLSVESGVQCLLKMWLNYSYEEFGEGLYCNATWDNVYCWPPTQPGKIIYRLCSETLREMDPFHAARMEGNAKRVCLDNGTWAEGNKTDYSECAESFKSYLHEVEEDNFLAPIVQNMLFYGSIFSLATLVISLAVFYFYRCLWCDRVTVQVHLMVALLLRFVLLLVMAEPYVVGRVDNYRNVDLLCKAVLVMFLYATVASIKWMFIQGLFLNISLSTRAISSNTSDHLKVYYIVGWGNLNNFSKKHAAILKTFICKASLPLVENLVVPALIVLAYVISMMFQEKQEKCWQGYLDMDQMWILLAPIIFALVINGVFLLNILRVLMKKVRNSNSRSDNSQIKAAGRATVFLFPVLGINNLLLLYNPGGEYNKYFVILSTFFGSTQGIFVALVYCFNNKEVKAAVRRSIQRMKARREVNSSQIPCTQRSSRRKSSLVGITGDVPTVSSMVKQKSVKGNNDEETSLE